MAQRSTTPPHRSTDSTGRRSSTPPRPLRTVSPVLAATGRPVAPGPTTSTVPREEARSTARPVTPTRGMATHVTVTPASVTRCLPASHSRQPCSPAATVERASTRRRSRASPPPPIRPGRSPPPTATSSRRASSPSATASLPPRPMALPVRRAPAHRSPHRTDSLIRAAPPCLRNRTVTTPSHGPSPMPNRRRTVSPRRSRTTPRTTRRDRRPHPRATGSLTSRPTPARAMTSRGTSSPAMTSTAMTTRATRRTAGPSRFRRALSFPRAPSVTGATPCRGSKTLDGRPGSTRSTATGSSRTSRTL